MRTMSTSPPSMYMPKETSGREKLSKKSPTASVTSISTPAAELNRTKYCTFCKRKSQNVRLRIGVLHLNSRYV